jgi:hypothetical protein
MSLSQLAASYNALPGVKAVKRFASRADALRRIARAQKAQEASAPASPKREKQRAVQPATSWPKPVQPGSKREKFVNRLIDHGITLAWAQEEVGWSKRDVADVLYQLSRKYGYSYDRVGDTWRLK